MTDTRASATTAWLAHEKCVLSSSCCFPREVRSRYARTSLCEFGLYLLTGLHVQAPQFAVLACEGKTLAMSTGASFRELHRSVKAVVRSVDNLIRAADVLDGILSDKFQCNKRVYQMYRNDVCSTLDYLDAYSDTFMVQSSKGPADLCVQPVKQINDVSPDEAASKRPRVDNEGAGTATLVPDATDPAAAGSATLDPERTVPLQVAGGEVPDFHYTNPPTQPDDLGIDLSDGASSPVL